jgi:hypothetical protein
VTAVEETGWNVSGATVLFLPYPSASGSWGSVMKLIAVAHESRARGDRVVFHVCPPVDRYIAGQGFETLGFDGAVPNDLSRPVESFYDAYSALGFDCRAFWDRIIQAEDDAITRVRPHAMVSHMRPSAALTAIRHGVPLASFASWCTDPRSLPAGDHPLDAIGRRLAWEWAGVRVATMAELVSCRSDVQWATSFPRFEPELVGTPRLIFTGHVRPSRRPGADVPAVPARLVIVYTSSAAWNVGRVHRSLDLAATRVGAVVWCVTRASGVTARVGARVHLHSYLPLEELLPRSRALIFHGGQSTALASLEHGLPSLAVPGRHYERRYNAARLAQLGAGIHGQLADLRPSRLTTIMERLLEDDGLRASTTALREMATYGGAPVAADSLDRLIVSAPQRRS